MPWRRRRAGRFGPERERGSVVVEAALIIPLMATMFCGTVEYSLALATGNAVSFATRQGARTAATVGRSQDADYRIVQSVLGSSGSIKMSQIRAIVVYKANSADGTLPDDCVNALRKGQPGVGARCNIYRPGDHFLGAPPMPWEPLSRGNGTEAERDFIGVYIELAYTSPLGVLIRNRTIADTTVFRMDPGAQQPIIVGGQWKQS